MHYARGWLFCSDESFVYRISVVNPSNWTPILPRRTVSLSVDWLHDHLYIAQYDQVSTEKDTKQNDAILTGHCAYNWICINVIA